MSVALGLGLGFFVLTAVASVLGVGLVSGYRNTVDLLRQKAELLVSSESDRIRLYLGAAEAQVTFIADRIATHEVEPGPSEEFTALMYGALAATPQIVSVSFTGADLKLIGAERKEDDVLPVFSSIRNDDDLMKVLAAASEGREPFWGKLLWREQYGQATLNYHHPIERDGEFLGVVSALVSTTRLSEFISDVEMEFGANAFVLHGRDAVLAHPLMTFGYTGLTRLSMLPAQATFGDPILASMWEERPRGSIEERVLSGPGVRFAQMGELRYVILYREIDGYGDRPLIVGTYFESVDLMSEVLRLRWAVILCLVISIAAALTAAYLGRQIARPVRRLADNASKVHDLEFSGIERIPGSFFKELNDAAHAFNSMLDGLRWFERYVPKALVRRLMSLGPEEAATTSRRDVTVMFTDIVGFTALSEGLSAEDAAALLNAHFTLVATCVEAEGGTVDKYMGDSVMALWGAPEAYPDMADRALRTALAVRRTLAEDNRRRETAGGRGITLRIGIHLGTVVAGNIGSPGRIDYTVVGDPVNVAQRLEEIGKRIGQTAADANILVSGNVKSAAAGAYTFEPLGAHALRGRREEVEIYALEDGPVAGQ